MNATNPNQAPSTDLLINEAAIQGRWYLRPKDIEQLTGVAVSTIRDAIYRGELNARKFRGRGWLITTDDARRWIEEQSVPSTKALARAE